MRNKHKGRCYRCGAIVFPNDGHFEKLSQKNRHKHPDAPLNTKWLLQHDTCAIKYRGTNQSIWNKNNAT